jgi:hypothetical protein
MMKEDALWYMLRRCNRIRAGRDLRLTISYDVSIHGTGLSPCFYISLVQAVITSCDRVLPRQGLKVFRHVGPLPVNIRSGVGFCHWVYLTAGLVE